VYFALVRSKLEYATSAWDPHSKTQIEKIEMVQRRAARFVLKDYDVSSSVTQMLEKLNWNSLSSRRQYARLKNFYLVYNGIGGWIDLMQYIQPAERLGRAQRSYSVRSSLPRSDHGKYSYINRTVSEWNSLPENLFTNESNSVGIFKNKLRSHLFRNNDT
jgi:hypothetical protein